MRNTLGSQPEYHKASLPIYHPQSRTSQSTLVEDLNIVGGKRDSFTRTIKESIYIRVNNPTLNSNSGKYKLPYIRDRVMFTVPQLKIINQQE